MRKPLADLLVVKRTRTYRKNRWLAAAGLLAVWMIGEMIIDRWSGPISLRAKTATDWSFHALIYLSLIGIVFWQIKSSGGWNRPLALTHADELQGQRRRDALARVAIFALLCFLTYWQGTWPHKTGLEILLPIMLGIALPLAVLKDVGGLVKIGWLPNAYMNFADDELTKALRGRAVAVGCGVLMFSVGAGFPLSLLYPSYAPWIMLLILWLGLSVPTITLAWLEVRAERDG